MQPSNIGWNIEGADLNNRRAIIRNELMSYRANWHLCLGDEGLAVELLNHTERGVILRIFDPFNEWTDGGTFDNTFWQTHSPESIIAYVKVHLSHLLKYDNLVFSIGNNEPATRGNTSQFVAWCVRLADLGKQAGIRFAIAEIATAKSVWHDEVIAGVWDDLIRAMDKYRGFHIFTIHEYTTGILPACLLPDYPLNLDNPDALKQSLWQNSKINLSTIEGNYHIGRGALISNVRAKEIGIEPIPFVVTECAFDWMADVVSNRERAETLGHLENTHKVPTHDFMRGSTGHQRYHEWLMNKTGFQGDWNEYLFAQYQWFVEVYPSECEGLTIFALNHDWDIPEGHDMSHPRNDRFRQRVINEPITKGTPMTTPTPITPDMYTMEAMIISTKNITNIRDDHDGGRGKVKFTLQGDDQLEVMISNLALWEDDNKAFFWYRIEYNDQVLYVANTKNLVRSDVPVSPPVDNPDVPDTPPETPDDVIQEQIAKVVQDAIEPLEARIKALELDIAHLLEPVIVDVPDVSYTAPRWALPMLASMFGGLERQFAVQKDFVTTGTPKPPLTLTDIDAIGYAASDTDSTLELVNNEGNITITNEPVSDTETTLTDETLNGAEDMKLAS